MQRLTVGSDDSSGTHSMRLELAYAREAEGCCDGNVFARNSVSR